MTGNLESTFCVGPDDNPDKYRLLQHVGGGGEAQLWQAELAVAGSAEPVAVKILRPELMGDFARLNERWRDQAELLRFVRNPGVVGVREHFEGTPYHLPGTAQEAAGRSLYLVMNWVDGLPLRDWLMMNRDPMERTQRVLRHLEQAADVLDWLHSDQATPSKRPVIHGDLSPGNIMITPTGQAMLVDFGLVRVVAHQTAEAAGTPGYAAPEVWLAGQYSPASDRYSFGAVAYYALTGSAPPLDFREIRAGLAAHPLVANAPPANLDQLMSIFSERSGDRPLAKEWVRLLRNTATTTASTTQHGPVPRPQVAAPPEPVRPRRTARTLGWATAAMIVVLTTGVVIGSTVLGGGAAPRNGQDNRATGSPETTTIQPAAPTTIDSPTTSALTTSRSANPTTPLTVAELNPADVTVRRRSGDLPLRFSMGYSVDLDSLADDWEVNNPSARKDIHNGYFGTNQLAAEVNFAPVSGSPVFAECVKATVYISRINLDRSDPGLSYCVRTSDGRFAWMTVLDAKQPVTLDVTVWDPPIRR